MTRADRAAFDGALLGSSKIKCVAYYTKKERKRKLLVR